MGARRTSLNILMFCLLGAFLAAEAGAYPLKKMEIKVPFLRNKTVYLSHFYQNNDDPEIVCFALHNNEETAMAAAKVLVAEQGGRIFRLDNAKQRLLEFWYGGRRYRVDPNRIFTPLGLKQNIRYYNKRSSQRAYNNLRVLARRLLRQYPLKQAWAVLGLHNNSDRDYSIISYKKGYRLGREAALIYIAPGQDKDDFYLVTTRRLFEYFKSKGFNVVLQHNKRVADDGSLAVYCARYGIPYINVEAQYGHEEQQRKMLEAVYALYRDDLARLAERQDLIKVYVAEKKMLVNINGFQKEYPISTGERYGQKLRRNDRRTPIGIYQVQRVHDAKRWKFRNMPNAYGPWFIRLATGWQGIGIHGTNEERTIGQASSLGCIRMRNSDIEELIRYIYKGLRVVILP